MTEAQNTTGDTFTELNRTLTQIKSLLHGAIALFQFFPQQQAEVNLLHMATELTERAETLVDSLYKDYVKTPAGPAPLANEEQEKR